MNKNKDIRIQSVYRRERPAVTVYECKPRPAQQQFKQAANINCIMERFNKTGVLGSGRATNTTKPQYGDFSNSNMSMIDMQNRVLQAQASFQMLPAKIRKRFNGNPSEFYAFMENMDENRKEAEELGLIKKPKEQVKNVQADPQKMPDPEKTPVKKQEEKR
jgi:phage internal scaffolding protein